MNEDFPGLRAFIGILAGFKLATLLIIIAFMVPSLESVTLLAALNEVWLLGVPLLAAIPVLAWYRLVRVRARRAILLQQEFATD